MKAYPIKARIRNEGSGPARLDVYDDIGPGGWFSDGVTAKDVAAQLSGIRGPLDVHISSSGGDVFDGLAIADAIRSHPAPVTTYVDGLAASIASVIAQAGEKRVMAPGSMLMIHDAWGFPDDCNEAGLLKMAATLGKVSDNLAQQYADRAGGTPQQWRQAMQAETWYTADEAVAAGLADEVAGKGAQLPQGVDLESLAARAPVRIMARLRTMPRAAAPDAGGDEGDGDGAPACKTCGGSGRLKHPGTGKNGMKCPGCDGTGTYDPDGSADEDDDGTGPDEDTEGMQDRGRRARGAAGKPYEPQPYKRTPDENVQCPACQKFGDDDSRYCGQCGTQLAGRTDVKEAELPPASNSAALRALVREELIAAGLVPGPDGYYIRAAGDVDTSDWDGPAAMSAAAKADDPAAALSAICAGRKAGPADEEGSYALPYKKTPSSPPNAAGVRNALARLPQTEGLVNEAEAKKTLQAAMKQVNPDWEPEDSAGGDMSGAAALERYRAALKGATA